MSVRNFLSDPGKAIAKGGLPKAGDNGSSNGNGPGATPAGGFPRFMDESEAQNFRDHSAAERSHRIERDNIHYKANHDIVGMQLDHDMVKNTMGLQHESSMADKANNHQSKLLGDHYAQENTRLGAQYSHESSMQGAKLTHDAQLHGSQLSHDKETLGMRLGHDDSQRKGSEAHALLMTRVQGSQERLAARTNAQLAESSQRLLHTQRLEMGTQLIGAQRKFDANVGADGGFRLSMGDPQRPAAAPRAAASAPAEDKPLSPQQKAAITRKKNAEAKKNAGS